MKLGRAEPGEGLLHDYESSDGPLFQALTNTQTPDPVNMPPAQRLSPVRGELRIVLHHQEQLVISPPPRVPPRPGTVDTSANWH